MSRGGRPDEPAVRWSDDPSCAPEGAARLLRGAPRARLPTESELARLEASVELLARAPAHVTQRPFASWRDFWARRPRAVAVCAGLLVTVSTLGTAVALWRAADRQSRLTRETVLPPVGVEHRLRPSPVAAPVGHAETNSPPPADRPAPVKHPRHSRVIDMSPDPSSGEFLLHETALIDAARETLAAEPARALALLEQHRREAPDGQLSPEREFLSVAALCRLGRIEEASQRAAELDRRRPVSAYAARARALVEAARGGVRPVPTAGPGQLHQQLRDEGRPPAAPPRGL